MPLCFHLENYQNCSESPDQQQKMNWAIEWQISSASWINDSQNYSLENYSRSLHLAFDRYLLCNVWKCFFENSIWLAAKEFNRVWFRILKAAKPVLHKRQKNIFFGNFFPPCPTTSYILINQRPSTPKSLFFFSCLGILHV